MSVLYQAVQILYWLTLSMWLGCTVFLTFAAPLIFRVVRRLEVRSGRYSDPALSDEQTAIVAGEIVGTLLARLGQVQMVCATALFPLLIAQFLLADLTGPNFVMAMVRFVMWLTLVGVLIYEWRGHYPRTWQLRQQFLDHADDVDAANRAREAFEHEHRRSEQLFLLTICILIGMVMMSANVTPHPTGGIPLPPAIAK